MRFLCVLLLTTVTIVLGDDLLTVATNNGCRKIAGLIKSAGLADALKAAQGVTLFAPNDDAVNNIPSDVMTQLQQNATLLASVLKFHVVVTAEGARVVNTDLEADNGVVHVLDKVIYPLPESTIPLTLTFNKNLDNLAYMVYEANLTDALAGSDFTVFAPSNAALNKLPGQAYNDLLMNATRLREVLFTHVVKGVVFSAGLWNGQSLTNLQGTQLSVTLGASGVKVDNVNVISADLPASNGVIHMIDTVIMPH